MGKLRLIVLDVLKPHEPSIIEMASQISDLSGIDGVDIAVIEIEKDVENVKITIKGDDVNFEDVNKIIEKISGTIHSIDKVSSGNKLIEEAKTPQD